MNKSLYLVTLFFFSLFLSSCNKGADRDELRAKSQAVGDIIQRSGTKIGDEKKALIDAQNRLRTGGGLFGKKAQSLDLFGGSSNSTSSLAFPVNPYLWKASLEVLEFMPLNSADPFSGIIITDWYSDSGINNQRCKLNIFIKGAELRSDNIKVKSFCEILNNNNWLAENVETNKNIQIEDAILNKAKKIKLSNS